MTRPFTTYKVDTEGVRGLREADDDTLSGGLVESLDLDGFKWFTQNAHHTGSANKQVAINKAGRLTISQSAIKALGDIPRDDRGYGRVILGLASGAIAIQVVPIDQPRASMLRIYEREGKRPTYITCNQGFINALVAAGVKLPVALDLKAYPKQLALMAKLPKPEAVKETLTTGRSGAR